MKNVKKGKLLILGCGGYARTISDIAYQLDRYSDVLYFDDAVKKSIVVATCNQYPLFLDEIDEVYPAFGDNEIRMSWIEKLINDKVPIASFLHPKAYISPTVEIGRGSVILPNATVNTGCIIGNGVIVNCGAIVDHDCVIMDGVHLCPGAIVKALNRISSGQKIESGQVIMNGQFPI